jgi:hypothetical protein
LKLLMSEKAWAESVENLLADELRKADPSLVIASGRKLAYAHEIREYTETLSPVSHPAKYETDLLIVEKSDANAWKPRVVIETKLGSISTHDAITSSEKASTHKKVHPYLRYGIFIGYRKHYPLPGRLFRHGAYFDFMLSWVALEPSHLELKMVLELLFDEVKASRDLADILYTSRSPKRKRYALLHKRLRLK